MGWFDENDIFDVAGGGGTSQPEPSGLSGWLQQSRDKFSGTGAPAAGSAGTVGPTQATAPQTYANGLLNDQQYKQLIASIDQGYGKGAWNQTAPGTFGKTHLNYWLDTIAHEGLTAERPFEYWLGRAQQPDTGQMGSMGGGASSYGQFLGGAGSALAPFTGQFKAPSAQDALNSPGLEFALSEGQKAIQRSAAAKGTLLTGGTLKDLAGWTQGMALQGYGDAYDRSRSEFDLGRNIFESNQDRPFGKLYDLAGLGKSS